MLGRAGVALAEVGSAAGGLSLAPAGLHLPQVVSCLLPLDAWSLDAWLLDAGVRREKVHGTLLLLRLHSPILWLSKGAASLRFPQELKQSLFLQGLEPVR